MTYFTFTSSPKLQTFISSFDPYADQEIWLHFIVNDEKARMRYADSIANLFDQNSIEYQRPYKKWVGIRPQDLRLVTQYLYQSEFISMTDREDFEIVIKEIESGLVTKSQIKRCINENQIDIINSLLITPFIEDVLEIAPRIFDVLKLFNAVFTSSAPVTLIKNVSRFTANETWKEFLINKQNITIKDADIRNLFDALTGLTKCYHGFANLESALTQSGEGLPQLKLQQNAILLEVEKVFFMKFSDLDNTYRFLSKLAFNLFRLNYSIADDYEPMNLLNGDQIFNRIAMHMQGETFTKMSTEVFQQIIENTFSELKLSLNDIAVTTRLRVEKMFAKPINTPLIKTEVQVNVCERKYGLFFKEFQRYQRMIQDGKYLGEQGYIGRKLMREKCAHAAENRVNFTK